MPGRVPAGLLQACALLATLGFLAAGCSSELVFPAVHDMPPPRTDATLTPDQVKSATAALISERDHLSTEVQAAEATAPPPVTTTGSIPAKAEKKKATHRPVTVRQAAAQPAAASQPPTAGATQTTGTEVKP